MKYICIEIEVAIFFAHLCIILWSLNSVDSFCLASQGLILIAILGNKTLYQEKFTKFFLQTPF